MRCLQCAELLAHPSEKQPLLTDTFCSKECEDLWQEHSAHVLRRILTAKQEKTAGDKEQ